MKMTIFTRILVATLIPLLLVLLFVMGIARDVIYNDGAKYIHELVGLTAQHISEQAALKLENIAVLQSDISKEMANVDLAQPYAKQRIDGLLTTLLFSSRDLFCTWFVFEPGIFTQETHYHKSIMRANGEILEIESMSEEQLNNPSESPWYNIPLSTGQAYSDVDGYSNYRLCDGLIQAFTMVYPINTPEGRTIGCVGLDILYENLFPMSSLSGEAVQTAMLVSEDGIILFSPNDADIGNVLWDYGFQDPIALSRVLQEGAAWHEEIESPFSGEKLLACLYPIEIDQKDQTIYLYCDMSLSSLYDPFSDSINIIVAAGALGMVLLALCVFITTRGITRHVKRITDSFYRVTNGSAEETLSGEHIPIYDTNVRELDKLQSALVNMIVQLRRAHGHKLKAVEAEFEKEKAIASAQAKINFFAAMSHEIRTPMNAILGISEIMLHEGNLTPSQEKYIEDIKVSSDALLNILNDILDISKLETGKMELHPEHYSFKALIDNVVSLAAHLSADANLKFIFEPHGELPSCLYGDGTRLRQILLNLIGNAIKFTKDGYVLLRVYIRRETISFDVEDTGIGIRENEIDTIFETFKRLDTKRNREVRGTGLGLSISKNLVELMGGSISAKSVYDAGSTFSFTIPLILGDESMLRHTKSRLGARYSEALRVLIVDDDETNLRVSSGLLRAAHGIHCDTAMSGWEAIAMVKQTRYDIIFMDHMMPELDGLDTTKHIRNLGKAYQDIPIIALTANAMIGTRKELMDGGMNDFLAKPVQSEKLQEILDAWVPEEKRLPDAAGNAEAESAPQPVAPQDGMFLSGSDTGKLLEKVGVNALAGLENIGFDEVMYLQAIRLLVDRLPRITRLLNDLLRKQNMQEFRIHAHALKGSLSNIGAGTLAEDALWLETAASKDRSDYCQALLPSLTEKLLKFHDALNKVLPESNSDVEIVPFDKEKRSRNFESLCLALDSYDYEAVTNGLNEILSMRHEPEMQRMISRLKTLINNFDYPGAAAMIRGELM